jgi:Uma2 family endonuclease
MPNLPRTESITVVPDWVCEILSPTTRRHDLLIKLPFYAQAGVPWCWLVDLDARVVSTLRNADGVWAVEGSFGDDPEARIPPFGAVPQDLSTWWTDLREP